MGNIGSLVQFEKDEIRVFTYADAVNKNERLQGVAILISAYVLRLCAAISVDRAALAILKDAIASPHLLDSYIDTLLEEYRVRLNLTRVDVRDGGITPKAPKSMSYLINYRIAGDYVGQFKPKGFGLLGKNVELSAALSCLLVIKHLLNNKGHFPHASEAIYTTLSLLSQHIETIPKIGITEERRIVKKIIDILSPPQ